MYRHFEYKNIQYRDDHGNGTPYGNGMEIPWESHGNRTKNEVSRWNGIGNENNIVPSGNNCYSNGNKFPKTAVMLQNTALYILCRSVSIIVPQ